MAGGDKLESKDDDPLAYLARLGFGGGAVDWLSAIHWAVLPKSGVSRQTVFAATNVAF